MKKVIDITSEKYINVSISANNEEIKIDKYSVKDCVLVRTTSGFPINCIVKTPHNNKTVIMNGISTILGVEINKKIREMYEPLSNEFKEIEKLTELKYRNLRPTVHFCINGLVTNVEGNDFTKPNKVERIISTAPSNTEVLVALGMADKLVAVDKYSEDVKGISEDIPKINFRN